MKLRLSLIVLALALCVVPAVATRGWAQDKPQEKPKEAAPKEAAKDQPKLSEEESKHLDKMNKAATLAEKTKLGIEFIKKFKKNTAYRGKIASYLSGQIFSEKDPAAKVQAAQQFVGAFDQPGEADAVTPALIDGYVTTGKFDEAFGEGAKYMAAHPEDVFVAVSLGVNGATQVQKQGATWKHAKATDENLTRATEMLEQDKKPEKTDKEFWTNYRNAWLPKVYQAQGALFYTAKDTVKARESLEKAFGFDPNDVFTLNYLIGVTIDEYQVLAQRYQTEKKSDLYDKAVVKMDEAIDYLARAVAITDGKTEPQTVAANTQFKDQLKQYFDFRNPGKSAEMNALVEKYKKK